MPGADWPACGRLVALLATCLIAVTAYLYGLDSSGIASINELRSAPANRGVA